MPNIQKIDPDDIMPKPNRLTEMFRSFSGWVKPQKSSLHSAYCRTSVFYEEAIGPVITEWLEAHEGDNGYWTLISKTKEPNFSADAQSPVKYQGVAISTKLTFEEILNKMHLFEEGQKVFEASRIENNTDGFYRDVATKEGFIFEEGELKVKAPKEREDQQPSITKIVQKAQLDILKSFGRTLVNANTENGFSLPDLFGDEDYKNKVEGMERVLTNLSEVIDYAFASVGIIMDPKGFGSVKMKFADLKNNAENEEPTIYTFNFPVIGGFDYDYGADGIDRCIYSYGDDEKTSIWTGPFAVEKYIEHAEKMIVANLSFLPEDIKKEIKIFFVELAFVASTAHARNLFDMTFDLKAQQGALDIERDISQKLAEKLKAFSKLDLIDRQYSAVYQGLGEKDKRAIAIPQRVVDLLQGLRGTTTKPEFKKENVPALGHKRRKAKVSSAAQTLKK